MKIHFVAPAFGFQKNMPYPDNDELQGLIEKQWNICRQFGVSIGFHSGSGKSAENYQVMGQVTGCNLEIKTSGRYTYEMGRALAESKNESDQALWRDWYRFTVDLAVSGSFSEDETERAMARSFVVDALNKAGEPNEVFESADSVRAAIGRLDASPDQMFWFEYNFLHVLAAEGRAEKASLGDHSAAGYRQRARFYTVSDEARLNFARRIAEYIVFLAENTGLVPAERCAAVRKLLRSYQSLEAFLDDISK